MIATRTVSVSVTVEATDKIALDREFERLGKQLVSLVKPRGALHLPDGGTVQIKASRLVP